MPFVYIGRKNGYVGKTMWEILGNLRDFGKGRIVVRSKYERLYKEPSYFRIVHAQPLMDEKNLYGRVLVEEVFRGRKNPEIRDLTAVTYKNDFKLVPKDEEHKLLNAVLDQENRPGLIVPSHVTPPPLLSLIAAQRRASRGEPSGKVEMEVVIHEPSFSNSARKAQTGETPTLCLDLKPSQLSPYKRLYEGIERTQSV